MKQATRYYMGGWLLGVSRNELNSAKAKRRRRAGKESNHQKRRRMAREAELQRARDKEIQRRYDAHMQARLRRELGRLEVGLARLEELGDVEG